MKENKGEKGRLCPFGAFNPFLRVYRHLVFVNERLECGTGGLLCHGIGRIEGAFDPAAFGDFTTFIALAKAHNVDHESFFLSCAEFDDTIEEGFGIGAKNE